LPITLACKNTKLPEMKLINLRLRS
jgi:hypothetical protein